MNGDLTIDVGSAIPYVVERILEIFGKDSISQEQKERFNKQIQSAVMEASWVQCIGMHKPVPITDLYQPMRLLINGSKTDFFELLKARKDGIIFGGPGRGKTTLIHWVFVNLLNSKEWLPILYTLRWPKATADLVTFVEEALSKQATKPLKKFKKNARIVLLVDGYDEIKAEDRKRVSEALRTFGSLKLGNFYLTCRSFYEIIDLKALHCFIDDFQRKDAIQYVNSFSKVYGTKFDAKNLMDELEAHSLSDFASSPLMLALICILKSGPMPTLPRNTIGIIRRAIDTLTLRWDEAKGISRESRVPIDGYERVRCLMRIAYHMTRSVADEGVIHRVAQEHVNLLQQPNIDIRKLLVEMAQWYGILIPITPFEWGFVHRTMYDYLAARFWVENGKFTPNRVREWNARAAYAACLVDDATPSLVQALKVSSDIYAVTECLYNNAPFDSDTVGRAVVERFDSQPSSFDHQITAEGVKVSMDQDFFSLASDNLLFSILYAMPSSRTPSHDLVLAYVFSELFCRNKRLTPQLYNRFRLLYVKPQFIFRVKRKNELTTFTLSDLATDPVK